MYKMYCIVCYYALAPLQAKSGRCQFERTVTTNPPVQAPHHHDHQLHHHRRGHHHHKQIVLLCFLDLYIYKNKYPNPINYIITINAIIVVIIIVVIIIMVIIIAINPRKTKWSSATKTSKHHRTC